MKLPLCKITDVPVGRTKYFKYGFQQGILIRDADGFHAFKNFCLHMGGPLRPIDGGKLKCQWHEAEFDMKTGEAFAGFQAPAGAKLITIDLEITGDQIFYFYEPPADPFND